MNSNLNSSYNIGSINTNAISNRNKLNSLYAFVRLLDYDIILLQEVENSKLSIPGFNVITNVDENKRGTAIALKSHIPFSNVQRSLDSRIITVKVGNFVTICNCYAPSGSNHNASRESMFKSSLPFYLQNSAEHLIIGGDFNCVVSCKDSTGSGNFSLSLSNLVRSMSLSDTWEILHNNENVYSYIRANTASRLDRIYISESLIPHMRTAEYFVNSFSDHKSLKVRCCLPNLGKSYGKGFWSLRTHILTEENLEEFGRKWNLWLRQKRDFPSWTAWWCDYAKPKICSFFRWKTNEHFRNFHAKNEYLYRQLRNAYDSFYGNPAGIVEINKIKAQMLSLQSQFSRAYERINDKFINGENISAYQLGDRTKKKNNSTIKSIESNNQILNQPSEVENHILDFFKSLYSAEAVGNRTDLALQRIIQEGSLANDQLMNEITTTEIFFAIKSSASRKSPGKDGIPKEFYAKAFNIIHAQLNLILNEMLTGNIPEKMLEGIIVLCRKKSEDKTIRGYRPISLLNFDYKILSRILKQRLEKVLVENNLLNASQKCSNAKRNIFEAVNAIKDRIIELNHKLRHGKLISFDLDHAFDRVNHNFLYNVLRNFRFNPRFVLLLEKIMSVSSSRLLLNGNLSPSFPIQRSVRQGDPLSMHLFVLYLHPLLEKLTAICNDPLELVVAYADDISVIIVDDTKLEAVRLAFNDFERCSGAVLNENKTVAVDIGPQTDNRNTAWPNIQDSVKILGVTFFNTSKQTIEFNWNDVIRKTSRLMWLFKPRNLCLQQKIIALNTFVTSRLWYMAAIFSIPNAVAARMTSLMGAFIWERYPTRVPMEQLTLEIYRGGLNLHLPMHKSKSLLISRFIKTIDNTPFALSYTNCLTNPPNLAGIPSEYLCLKYIGKIAPYLPDQLKQNPTASTIHNFFRGKLQTPKVMQEYPNVEWRRVWKNIRNRELTVIERSLYYLLVNGKIPHAALLYRQNRIDNASCQVCSNTVEDLEHKLSMCSRVKHLWDHIRLKLETIVGRSLHFKDLQVPMMQNTSRYCKNKALKMFIVYVNFILEASNPMTVEALDFVLNL